MGVPESVPPPDKVSPIFTTHLPSPALHHAAPIREPDSPKREAKTRWTSRLVAARVFVGPTLIDGPLKRGEYLDSSYLGNTTDSLGHGSLRGREEHDKGYSSLLPSRLRRYHSDGATGWSACADRFLLTMAIRRTPAISASSCPKRLASDWKNWDGSQ